MSMDTLHIRRFAARYHLTFSAELERGRLDKVLRAVVDEALELALERAGVPAYEEICLRSLAVPVRLRLSRGDSALAREWSNALADAIRRAAGSVWSRHIVRYGSRAQAMIDLAFSVARGDYERAWAWKQLGIWQGGESPSASEAIVELLGSLVAEPLNIVPVLRAFGGREAPAGLFAGLAARMTSSQWIVLARAALFGAGASPALLAYAEPGIAETPRQARRLLAASSLAPRIVKSIPLEDIDLRRALAVLLILDAEPSILPGGGQRAVAHIAAVADALHPAVARSVLARSVPESQARPAATGEGSASVTPRYEHEPAAEAAPARESLSPESRRRSVPEVPRDDTQAPNEETTVETESRFDAEHPWPREQQSPSASEPFAAESEPFLHGGHRRGQQAERPGLNESPEPDESAELPEPASLDEFPIPKVRRRAQTAFGGLLFMLRVIEDLGLPKEIPETASLAGRSFRWVLHRLAIELVPSDVPISEDDAAVLAFAGLQPDDAPPSRGEDAPPGREFAGIDWFCTRIESRLGELLADEQLMQSELLPFVCNRRAEIVTDPGWIAIHFPVDDVSTAIRRAGLDLDPGYLPWLGVVVRFIYE